MSDRLFLPYAGPVLKYKFCSFMFVLQGFARFRKCEFRKVSQIHIS